MAVGTVEGPPGIVSEIARERGERKSGNKATTRRPTTFNKLVYYLLWPTKHLFMLSGGFAGEAAGMAWHGILRMRWQKSKERAKTLAAPFCLSPTEGRGRGGTTHEAAASQP